MKVRAFTLRWSDDAHAFDTEPLDAFCLDHDIIDVFEHFFMCDARPAWAVMLTYRPMTTHAFATTTTPSSASQDPRTQLREDERTLYEALRRWRNDRARDDGKPPYVIFTNNQMLAITRARPQTKTELAAVHGVGATKVDTYADDVLGVVAQISTSASRALNEDQVNHHGK